MWKRLIARICSGIERRFHESSMILGGNGNTTHILGALNDLSLGCQTFSYFVLTGTPRVANSVVAERFLNAGR
jgi:hypothetical protein